MCAFVGAVIIGPRIGRFSKDGKVRYLSGVKLAKIIILRALIFLSLGIQCLL